MKNALKLLLTLCLITNAMPLLAQDAEMADSFRRDGKIYVVVAIVLIVLAGLIAYLIMTDRKIKKLEERLRDTQTK